MQYDNRAQRRPEHRRRFAASLLATFVACAFVGCPGELENPERFLPANCPAPIDVPTEIFIPSCGDALCHSSVEPEGALDLVSDNVLDRLLDVPSSQCEDWLIIDSVTPGASLLLHKLEARSPSCGARMPLGGGLSREQVACIRDWVFAAVGRGDGGLPDADMSDADTSDAQDEARDGAASAEASD